MTDAQVGKLLGAFASSYWSVSAQYVIEKIQKWHPEVNDQQILRVIRDCNEHITKYHCCLVHEGLEEPEIAVEHLILVNEKDLDRFLAARIKDKPYCDYPEETLFLISETPERYDIEEIASLRKFGKEELGLSDIWIQQLIHTCVLCQPYALCENESWVISALEQESFGRIHFKTLQQVEQFRKIGNELFRVFPNPVLKGWRPCDLEQIPILPDDIPDSDADIPDDREAIEGFFKPYGGREKFADDFLRVVGTGNPKREIGRNDPCPCGSGKKYKKCCGAG